MTRHIRNALLPDLPLLSGALSGTRHPRLVIVAAFVFIALLVNLVSGNFGVLGADSDDLLRFVQIRDYLQGQNWFDTDQYRMGLTAAGTDMHWSRVPDIPIILLTHFFDIFVSQDTALDIAIFLWPPLSGMIVFAAFLIGVEHIDYEGDRKYFRVFTYLLAAIFVASYFRFKSGGIDHHNIQFGCVAMAMVLAMDPQMRFWRYFLSGFITAISISIGPEVYLFAAVICGFIAVNWAIQGVSARQATQGFGIGLAIGLFAIFFATVPPSNYTVIYCDALSLITITAAGLGGLGLALTARLSGSYGGDESAVRRMMALALLGVVCLVVLSFQAPQCLANPLTSLPLDVKELWLDAISEAMPIYNPPGDWPMFIPMVLGPLLVALYVFIQSYIKRYKAHDRLVQLWSLEALMGLLFLMATALTIYQVRFSPFAYIFAILPLARWMSQSYEKGLAKGGTNIKYILCLAVSIPVIWALPGSLFVNEKPAKEGTEAAEIESLDCESKAVMAAFNRLPDGLVMAGSNHTGTILIETQHRVVSGNYHRNWQGISAEIQISIAAPDVSYQMLTDNKIDYVFYCKTNEALFLATHNSKGLLEQIKTGNIPAFLVPVSAPDLEGGKAIIFKVSPKK